MSVTDEFRLKNSKKKWRHLVSMNSLIFPTVWEILLMILKDCRPEVCPSSWSWSFIWPVTCCSHWHTSLVLESKLQKQNHSTPNQSSGLKLQAELWVARKRWTSFQSHWESVSFQSHNCDGSLFSLLKCSSQGKLLVTTSVRCLHLLHYLLHLLHYMYHNWKLCLCHLGHSLSNLLWKVLLVNRYYSTRKVRTGIGREDWNKGFLFFLILNSKEFIYLLIFARHDKTSKMEKIFPVVSYESFFNPHSLPNLIRFFFLIALG